MSDFGALPPEINSARMYAGPGSGPLLASAAAWDALAAQLETFGAGYSAEISSLQGESWSGGASTAMAAAAAPYIAWITATAGQAEQTAGQARAAAAAYEAAVAATVPPAVVLANRTLLATLVATNFFGQNTPAIAATEADYAEMWAQDATAMYAYAMSASAAATLTSFSEPPQTTNPAVSQGLESSIGHSHSTLSQLMSAVAQRLQTLGSGRFPNAATAESSATEDSATSTSTSGPLITAVTDFDELDASTILTFAIPKTVFQGGSFSLAASQTGGQASALPAIPAPSAGAATTASTTAPTDLSGTVLASTGRAAPIGRLSVPPGWTAATPAAGPTTEPPALAETGFRALPPWTHPTDTPTNTSAGIPAAGRIDNAAGRRGGNVVFRMRDRRYRMPRPTLGG